MEETFSQAMRCPLSQIMKEKKEGKERKELTPYGNTFLRRPYIQYNDLLKHSYDIIHIVRIIYEMTLLFRAVIIIHV